ncbi:hypothetical protein HDV00_008938 [Rhizophlyctis rosea]|nr:hypothetical protein HDV00_008938 [Rhizophlyctis rosea]
MFLTSRKHYNHSKFTNSIHDYELLSGIGGVDDVSFLVLAKHIPTGEFVGLKYTDLSLSPDFEFITELTEAVRNTSFCRHPTILPYYTTFIDKEMEKMWTVTMPMRAGTCRKVMNDYFPDGFSEPVVATILKEVLRAVIYMHENHMIHNDIRADNILLDFNGDVRVTGLRQMVSLAQHGAYVASVFSRVGDNIEWAAPEVMAQNNNYDEKADIYSFGITALELAFNRTPFDGWPALKVLLSKLEYDCPGIDTDKIMSPAYYKLIRACLKKDASERPSAQDLMDHPFFKHARNARYLEVHVMKDSGLMYKHGTISKTRVTP